MPIRQLLAILVVVPLAIAARADEVRYYEENGITYRETTRTVRQRVPETRVEEVPQTVYREEFVSESREQVRTYWTPVTEYRWESFWVGRWNPFAQPYLAYRHVPRTRWEERTEKVDVPTVTRRLVPETKTVRRLVPNWRTEEREVVGRVAVSGPRSTAPIVSADPPLVARREPVGGLTRLGEGPPRQGTGWRASGEPVRR